MPEPPGLHQIFQGYLSTVTTYDTELLIDGPTRSSGAVVLAHGAGAAMDTDFMNTIAAGIADLGWRVVRFEFPYMVRRRQTGKRRPPDREPVLRQTWLDVMESVKADKLVIGGKSMGGRIASLIADDADAQGLICLGYPFHPTGKPEKLRVDHLRSLKTPMLIVQGERDPFGNRTEVASYKLPRKVKMHWLHDGDHSFKPRKSSGTTLEQNLADAVLAISTFLNAR